MRRTVWAVLGFLALTSGSLSAHHAYSSFHRDQMTTIEGTLIAMMYRNPHVMMLIRTADGTEYATTWNSALSLGRDGVTPETLKLGDHLIVTGAPRIDERRELAMLSEVRRPLDGWDWKPARR